LETLGEAAVAVAAGVTRNFIEFMLLILKLIWDKTVMIRTKIVNIAKYVFVFVASPFVKFSISWNNMKRDMKTEAREGGGIRAALAFFPYLGKFMFGRRGFLVTAFNYAAPIVSIIFLFNVVSYATSSNFMLRLVVNGEFYGYIDSEQVFLDAEASVMQRVNYFSSDQTITLIPEFTIANVGSNDRLTREQIANRILERSDFNLVSAHGFFIDGKLYGAILDADLPLINETVGAVFAAHAGDDPDADERIEFVNDVVWQGFDLFLEESVVSADWVINQINATHLNGEPYLPIMISRTEEISEAIPYETIERPDDRLFVNSTNIAQRGVEGEIRHVARISYVNGEPVSQTIISSRLVSEPTVEIMHRGTRTQPRGHHSSQDRQHGRFIWPVVTTSDVPTGTVSRGLGGGHMGLDIAAPTGTPVVAGAGGTVVLAQHNNGSLGHTVIILHEDGMRTLYAHLSAIHVSQWQEVSQGFHIGNVGSTGRSTGPHLHMEVWEADSGRRLEPRNFLPILS
jgi:hypothetical protein